MVGCVQSSRDFLPQLGPLHFLLGRGVEGAGPFACGHARGPMGFLISCMLRAGQATFISMAPPTISGAVAADGAAQHWEWDGLRTVDGYM